MWDHASTFDSPGPYYPLLSLIDTQETVGRADGQVEGSKGTQLVDVAFVSDGICEIALLIVRVSVVNPL